MRVGRWRLRLVRGLGCSWVYEESQSSLRQALAPRWGARGPATQLTRRRGSHPRRHRVTALILRSKASDHANTRRKTLLRLPKSTALAQHLFQLRRSSRGRKLSCVHTAPRRSPYRAEVPRYLACSGFLQRVQPLPAVDQVQRLKAELNHRASNESAAVRQLSARRPEATLHNAVAIDHPHTELRAESDLLKMSVLVSDSLRSSQRRTFVTRTIFFACVSRDLMTAVAGRTKG